MSADVLYAGDMTVVSVVADNISVYCVLQSQKNCNWKYKQSTITAWSCKKYTTVESTHTDIQ